MIIWKRNLKKYNKENFSKNKNMNKKDNKQKLS